METVNQLFKKYQNSGGNMNFKEFLTNHDMKKNSMGDESKNIEGIFFGKQLNSIGGGIGGNPLEELASKKTVAFKNADAAGSLIKTANANQDKTTFGINNYVIIGAGVVIVGAIGWQIYKSYKKYTRYEKYTRYKN